jgi:uncharacterized Zn finger protein
MTNDDDDPLKDICEVCGAEMALVRTVPKVGGLPELHTYHCEACGHVTTKSRYE